MSRSTSSGAIVLELVHLSIRLPGVGSWNSLSTTPVSSFFVLHNLRQRVLLASVASPCLRINIMMLAKIIQMAMAQFPPARLSAALVLCLAIIMHKMVKHKAQHGGRGFPIRMRATKMVMETIRMYLNALFFAHVLSALHSESVLRLGRRLLWLSLMAGN